MAVHGNAFTLLTSSENTGEHAVKLFDREVLAHVTVCAGMQGGVHLVLVVADAGEYDDWERRIRFAHEGDERNAIHLGHLKVDNCDFAVMVCEPGGGLKPVGQGVASMPALAKVGDEKLRDAGVIIDNEELGIFAVWRAHLL